MTKQEDRAKKIGAILEYNRLKLGMTQEEFAKFLEIPRGSLAYYLLGTRVPSPKNIKKIGDKFNIDIAKIITEV